MGLDDVKLIATADRLIELTQKVRVPCIRAVHRLELEAEIVSARFGIERTGTVSSAWFINGELALSVKRWPKLVPPEGPSLKVIPACTWPVMVTVSHQDGNAGTGLRTFVVKSAAAAPPTEKTKTTSLNSTPFRIVGPRATTACNFVLSWNSSKPYQAPFMRGGDASPRVRPRQRLRRRAPPRDAPASPWYRRHIANQVPIVRLIHSSDSKKAGTETESKKSAIEKIATMLMALPAIQDVCHPSCDLNPNNQGDKTRNPPNARLMMKSTKASVFRFRWNMATSLREGQTTLL
ncbi:hypothetical protein J2S34_003841 [Nitrobacter winogradskyi]|uniref:Uncharacterized protein n=1 Tax=Nitrobacter winogradskyi TaxID=913 RepID=A0ACC6ANB5_NITWI|nr:hypothetical protein [Nitrobacter winogradskyi]